MQRFTATAQGEFSGIGGSGVIKSAEARAHTEVATNKYEPEEKRESSWTTPPASTTPARSTEDDYDENGLLVGRTLVQEGEIWLVDRPIEVSPHSHARRAGRHMGRGHQARPGELGRQLRRPMPDGEHWNVLEFANL